MAEELLQLVKDLRDGFHAAYSYKAPGHTDKVGHTEQLEI